MFKKSNRNFRQKREENSDDEQQTHEQNESANLSKPEISNQLKKNIKNDLFQKTDTKNVVLSFMDDGEEEEGMNIETFKVKKSKESRRLAKEKKLREKREKEEITAQGINLIEEKVTIEKVNDENIVKINEKDEIILFNNEIKIKPLRMTSSLSVTERLKKYSENILNDQDLEELKSLKDTDEDYDEKLRRLREEMETLNGDESNDIENEMDDNRKSMKLMLKSGHIPDANIIHELKKKRQQAARQSDFISIDDSNKQDKDESRIVREDDHDYSDDEERVSMNLFEKSTKERQQTRDYFLAFEQGSDDENGKEEDEYEKWEKEQIRKGVQMTQVISSKLSSNLNPEVLEKFIGYNLQSEPMDVETKPDIQLTNLPKISFTSIKENLKKNSIDETNRAHLSEKQMISQNLESSLATSELIQTNRPNLNEKYKFYQEIRSYTLDIIDCFNEKVDEIEKIETKWVNLFKTRAQKIETRRQEDIKDQDVEYSLKYSQDTQGIRKTMDPGHQRRAIERELRRKKRREMRVHSIEIHHEGLSSDDDENQNDQVIFDQKRSDIVQNISEIFKDVLEDYCDIDIIKKRFEEWKKLYPESYDDAYVSLSLVKLFGLLVRHEILDWNPLETSRDSIEQFKWYKSLSNFNLGSKNDDDLLLVPRIIEKIVYQRINLIIENVYDPFSTKQTNLLTNLLKNLVTKHPSLNVDSNNTKRIVEAVVAKIRRAFDNDVFVPLLPKHVLENVDCPSRAFFHRQFWSCVKLFSNILSWNDLIPEKTIQELSLDSLLNRYIMVALQFMEMNNETVNKVDYIVKKLPLIWFKSNNEQTIPQLNNLCRFLRRISDTFYQNLQENKLSIKEFKDQIRSIRKIFVCIKAMNHAIELTNTFEVK